MQRDPGFLNIKVPVSLFRIVSVIPFSGGPSDPLKLHAQLNIYYLRTDGDFRGLFQHVSVGVAEPNLLERQITALKAAGQEFEDTYHDHAEEIAEILIPPPANAEVFLPDYIDMLQGQLDNLKRV